MNAQTEKCECPWCSRLEFQVDRAEDGVVYSFSVPRLTMDREHDAFDHGKRRRFTMINSGVESKHRDSTQRVGSRKPEKRQRALADDQKTGRGRHRHGI